MIHAVAADYAGGAIVVEAIDGAAATLRLPRDAGGWGQWFDFTVTADAGTDCVLRIVDAGDSSYPEGWAGYRAWVRDGSGEWRRTTTDYRDGVLTIAHRTTAGSARFAYFTPYDLDDHAALLARAGAARHDRIATSVDGRAIDRLVFGTGPRAIWLVGRQHPGESMASWWMEGAVDALLALAAGGDPLLDAASVHLVPLANPDGMARGFLRSNACGRDLNREWAQPSAREAPEIAGILAAMERSGVEVLLDVHGDEVIPHVFIDGSGPPDRISPHQHAGVARFCDLLLGHSAAFQTDVGYDDAYAGDAAPGMAARAVAARFGAIGMTLEMPFGDSRECPDPLDGWSAAASRVLGAATIAAVKDFVALPVVIET